MSSSTQPRVWLVTGAYSPFGYRLALAALARRDLVIAIAPHSDGAVHLRNAGAYPIRVDSQMSYSQVCAKLQQAVEQLGSIDYVIHNAEVDPQLLSSSDDSYPIYCTNSFTFSIIQLTQAAAEVSNLRGIAIVTPDFLKTSSPQNDRQRSSLQGTAQTVTSYKLARTSFVIPWAVNVGTMMTGNSPQQINTSVTLVANRITAHMVERAPSERGIRVL